MVEYREIPLVAFLAFLFALALYCLVLALVNRRNTPVMVSGVWDSIGLLLGLSGLLLVSVPRVLFDRIYNTLARQAIANQDPVEDFLLIWWGLRIAYYCVIVGGAGLLIWVRRHKTVVYNVDPLLFDRALARSLQNVHLHVTRFGRRLLLRPLSPQDDQGEQPASTEIQAGAAPLPIAERSVSRLPSDDRRSGQLDVEPFSALANVTLHWREGPPQLRVEIEDELRRNLDDCRALDNPAAGWFLGLCSLFFGFVLLAIIMMIVLPRG